MLFNSTGPSAPWETQPLGKHFFDGSFLRAGQLKMTQNFSINPSPATSLEVSSLQADQVDRNEAAAAQNFP